MKDKICKICGRIISYDTYFKRYVCRQCGYEENPIDNKGWHVVADGDLPPKPKDGIKRYLVTKQRQNDWSKRIVTALYWDGNDFYNDGLSGSRMRYVLAWRELPEPWEENNGNH